MSEKDVRFKYDDIEQESSVFEKVFFFILSIVLLVIGVKWLISICLNILIPENN
ncbi:MAG: hypothetical protein N2445_02925 [Acidobacteria bacterium]|nr:hypothetical protein [Acidobacteriota bacterium]